MNENELLKKRFVELDNRAYMKGYSAFSDFLNIDEISTLKGTKLGKEPSLFGGYENATRCVAGFGDDVQNYQFPIQCIEISPLQQKFADKLNHRDFLGSLMNLGINRNTLGDIVIIDNVGYLFCLDTISDYIVENLTRIKHTSVNCKIIDNPPEIINQLPDSQEIIVSSIRADVVIATVFKLSRNDVAGLFASDKVFINSRLTNKDSTNLKDDDIISVRGYGKFIYCQTLRQTKKDRNVIEIKLYR